MSSRWSINITPTEHAPRIVVGWDPQPWPFATNDPTVTSLTATGSDPDAEQQGVTEAHAGHGGHGLMMLVCCIPVILLALGLVATGVAGSGATVGALLCTVMMLAMPGSHGRR